MTDLLKEEKIEITQLKKENSYLKSELERQHRTIIELKGDIEKHLNSITYRVGESLVSAFNPSKNTFLLPYYLFKLFLEKINKKRGRWNNINLKNRFYFLKIERDAANIRRKELNKYYNDNMFIDKNIGDQSSLETILSIIRFSPIRNMSTYLIEENYKDTDDLFSNMEKIRKNLLKKYVHRKHGECISIIMPTHNRASIIIKAIDSVINQSYQNWELLIIDDASTDNTKNVVHSYQNNKIKYHLSTSCMGVSHARNIGFDNAQGKYIAYLDSDNEWHSDYLMIMINILEDNPEFKSVYCAQTLYDCKNKIEVKKGLRFGYFNRAFLENDNYIDINAFLHNKSLFYEYGGFNENLTSLEDWDLLLRYLENSFPFPLPCVLSKYYFHRSNNQLSFSKNYKKNKELLRKNISKNVELQIQYKKILNNPFYKMFNLKTSYNLSAIRKVTIRKVAIRKVTIIIPSYESLNCLKVAIEAVRKYTKKENYDLIIVDNNSSESIIKYLQSLENKIAENKIAENKIAENKIAKVVYNKYNFGFTYAINQGIKLADSKTDIVLLNNDAIVTKGWLDGMYEVVDKVSNVGIVAPRQVLPPFTKTCKTHVPACDNSFEVDVNLSYHHDNIIDPIFFPERGFVKLSFVPFFCTLILRKCLEKIGILDFNKGRHYQSDTLFCTKALKNNFNIIYTPHSKVYHLLQQSTEELKKDKQMYKNLFIDNSWNDVDLKTDINSKLLEVTMK